ncbi:MAG: hypothetical protein M0R06_01115 [Sphaerochaeta sp.]|jgi:hypothetical protein|nr:hypothetical protein [Sphaerochaeta sp.]
MLYTTFALARKSNACVTSYRKLGEALGGITTYGKDTPIPLTRVLDTCDLTAAMWCLRCTTTDSRHIIAEFARRCAEHVRHYTEVEFDMTLASSWAAKAAKADMPIDVIVDTAISTACMVRKLALLKADNLMAGWVAEGAWQTQQFRELLETIEIVCAWCGKPMGSKPGDGQTGVSHGICPECVTAMKKEGERKWKS